MNPLINFKPRTRFCIRKIYGGLPFKKRLSGIGINKRTEAEILQNSRRHTLILIKIANRRIAVRRRILNNIIAKRI